MIAGRKVVLISWHLSDKYTPLSVIPMCNAFFILLSYFVMIRWCCIGYAHWRFLTQRSIKLVPTGTLLLFLSCYVIHINQGAGTYAGFINQWNKVPKMWNCHSKGWNILRFKPWYWAEQFNYKLPQKFQFYRNFKCWG